MLEYILTLFFRALAYAIFAYWLYHFVTRLHEYSQPPRPKNASVIMMVLLSAAYSLGRVVGRIGYILKR